MIRLGIVFSTVLFVIALTGAVPSRAATNAAPDFKEVYDLILGNAAGIGGAELNAAAVSGLLAVLGPKASLIRKTPPAVSTNGTRLVTRTFLFDGEIGYLRIARVAEGLAEELQSAYRQLSASNKLKGIVVDLRFTDGLDYSSAIVSANLFSLKKTVELSWGTTIQQTVTGSGMVSQPAVVLVNSQTSAAAEALAAILHDSDAGVTLGSRTAGRALLTKDFPLNNGDMLRIATAPVKLNGAEIGPVSPDIKIKLAASEEQAFYADGFFVGIRTNPAASSGTLSNSPASLSRRPRLNEAGLVRAHRQGVNPEDEEAALAAMPRDIRAEAPVVADPVLARALDLLKGLAIVRQAQP